MTPDLGNTKKDPKKSHVFPMLPVRGRQDPQKQSKNTVKVPSF